MVFAAARLVNPADPGGGLFERFMPLARQLARRYEGGREDLDDLEQIAAIGLIKAIDLLRCQSAGWPSSSFAFPTYLGRAQASFP